MKGRHFLHKNIGREPITPNELNYFLRKRGLDIKTFAAQIGYAAATVEGWIHGRGVMSRKAMQKVTEWGFQRV